MTIFIPTPLRPFASGRDTIEVQAATVSEALDQLTSTHPDLRKHLFTGEGRLRAFVNVYLNDEDVRYLPGKEATQISPGDTLSIIPSIAGGSRPERFPLVRSGRYRQTGTATENFGWRTLLWRR